MRENIKVSQYRNSIGIFVVYNIIDIFHKHSNISWSERKGKKLINNIHALFNLFLIDSNSCECVVFTIVR